MIMGDFNIGEMDWKANMGNSGRGQELLDLVGNCFLTQVVTKPTRGNNILDLVLFSDPEMVEDIDVKCPVVNSDHSVVEFKIVKKRGGG